MKLGYYIIIGLFLLMGLGYGYTPDSYDGVQSTLYIDYTADSYGSIISILDESLVTTEFIVHLYTFSTVVGNSWYYNYTVNGTEADYSCELFVDDVGFGVNETSLNDTETTIQMNNTVSYGYHDGYVNCTVGAIVNQSIIKNSLFLGNLSNSTMTLPDGTTNFTRGDSIPLQGNIIDYFEGAKTDSAKFGSEYVLSHTITGYSIIVSLATGSWNSPEDAPLGWYNVTMTAYSEGTETGNYVDGVVTLENAFYLTIPPTYSDNSTISTYAGDNIKHSLKWDAGVGLSGYIFSFDNGSGTLINGSWVEFSGTTNWSNVTKYINETIGSTIQWKVYANDTLDNWNDSLTYSYITILDDRFKATWNTSKAGTSNSTSITLPLESTGTYDFTVYWGDGSKDTITTYNQAEVTHDYGTAGTYDVSISGTIVGFRFNNGGDRLKIIDISQWGVLNVGNSNGYFYGTENLNFTGTDSLNLTGTTQLQFMFYSATNFNGNISGWDTSNITDMYVMFDGASSFNSNINSWDTSKVLRMDYMFSGASSFNQDLNDWNVSNVWDMSGVFDGASSFNGNISEWDTSKVTDMNVLFRAAIAFNNTISNWNVSSATNMYGMFNSATIFNQDLTNWCVTNIVSEPTLFATSSALEAANKPIWGTCPGLDTCTYTSGNWDIVCNDNCSLVQTDLGGNNYTLTGVGTTTGRTNITNYNYGYISGGCTVTN